MGKRKPGRPATGVTPVRSVRIGQVWDDAKAAAEEDGEKFAQFVARALQRELDNRNAAKYAGYL